MVLEPCGRLLAFVAEEGGTWAEARRWAADTARANPDCQVWLHIYVTDV